MSEVRFRVVLAMPLPSSLRRQGFTALSNSLYEALLCLDLTRSELAVFLLVGRLTIGCRNAEWVRLSRSDLSAVKVGPGHAGECLDRLKERGLLEQNSDLPEYRLSLPNLWDEEASKRRQGLRGLVHRQLAVVINDSASGSPAGDPEVPVREQTTSPQGSFSDASPWRFDRSKSRFVRAWEPPERKGKKYK